MEVTKSQIIFCVFQNIFCVFHYCCNSIILFQFIATGQWSDKYSVFCISSSSFQLQGSEKENRILQRNSIIVDGRSNEILIIIIITTITLKIIITAAVIMKMKDNVPISSTSSI